MTYDQLILNDNPVLYLPLSGDDNTSLIGALIGANGTASGSVGRTVFADGSGAALFNGVDQYIEVPDSDSLSVSTTGVLTIEAWLRPDVLQFAKVSSNNYVDWIGKSTPNNSEYVGRMYSLTSPENRPNRISGYCFNLSGGLGVGSYFQDQVTVGQWIHFMLVINTVNTSASYPTGYTKIYKNGVQRDQDALNGYNIVPQNGTAPFRIGSVELSSYFQGAIAKVAVYNYELTSAQIQAHTNGA